MLDKLSVPDYKIRKESKNKKVEVGDNSFVNPATVMIHRPVINKSKLLPLHTTDPYLKAMNTWYIVVYLVSAYQ